MVGELVTGLSLFKSMLDTAKGLKDMNDAAVRNTAVIELQEQILSAQEQQTTLINRVNDLEKEMTRFETWESEKERYQLHEFGGGTFAYTLKEGMENGEPPHRLCANCFQKDHKSILQGHGQDAFSRDMYGCPACGETFNFGERRHRPPQTPPSGRNWMG